MSVIFILILISIFSSYILLVNDQIGYSFDLVCQVKKNLKFHYKMEFIVNYVIAFFKTNYKDLDFPFVKNFNVRYSELKQLSFKIEINKIDRVFKIVILVPNKDYSSNTLINCYISLTDNDLLKLEYYQIEKG